jgi:hypothetical protein
MFKAVMENKNVLAVIHRRAGKDIGCLQLWVLRGIQRVGTHVYLFPLYSQARAVIWNGLDFDGMPFISNIPEVLIAKKNEARMEITLINGSRLILAGSNNIDSLMGTNPVTIIYSEFALHHPMARPYLNPILLQNGGIEIIQSTPRGKNHLYELYELVKDNPKYHVEHLSIEQTAKHDGTRIFTEENLQEARKMGMSEELIQQELFCSFNIGNIGAYFTREMNDMEHQGRILSLRANPNLPLHTVFDLGGVDSTAAWLFQVDWDYINLIALLQASGQGLKFYLDWADSLRKQWHCNWGNHFGPHDISQKHQSWEQAESRLMLARKAGWFFQITPKLSLEDGIEAIRYIFPKLRINKDLCDIGIRAIREYEREYDEVGRCFRTKPLHNWTSHIVDALRYLAVNYRRLYDMPQSVVKYTTSL